MVDHGISQAYTTIMVIEFRADFYGHNLSGLVYAYHETPLKKMFN